MEELIIFLTSQQGQYLCWALLFVGVVTTSFEVWYFNNIAKKIGKDISPLMSPDERESTELRIKKINIIKLYMLFYGAALIAVAIFGLTR